MTRRSKWQEYVLDGWDESIEILRGNTIGMTGGTSKVSSVVKVTGPSHLNPFLM